MKLNQFDKVTKSRKRVGRGIGSGKGKTCGRGHKGQKSRTGVALNGFEGGQQSILRRLPKFGFKNIFRTEYSVLNVGDLQKFVDAGRLKVDSIITVESLLNAGIVNRKDAKVKLLGNGELKVKLTIQVDAASKTAEGIVKKAGGEVTFNNVVAA